MRAYADKSGAQPLIVNLLLTSWQLRHPGGKSSVTPPPCLILLRIAKYSDETCCLSRNSIDVASPRLLGLALEAKNSDMRRLVGGYTKRSSKGSLGRQPRQ